MRLRVFIVFKKGIFFSNLFNPRSGFASQVRLLIVLFSIFASLAGRFFENFSRTFGKQYDIFSCPKMSVLGQLERICITSTKTGVKIQIAAIGWLSGLFDLFLSAVDSLVIF